MIDCCIFDLDGVVVDTARYHYLAWAALARELGFEFTPVQGEATKGVSRMASLEIVLRAGGLEGRFSAAERERLAAEKNARYLRFVSQMTPAEVLPGVAAFLHDVRSRGVRTVLGSASKNAGTILDRCGLRPLFDAVVDGNEVSRAKPDPEVFLLSLIHISEPTSRGRRAFRVRGLRGRRRGYRGCFACGHAFGGRRGRCVAFGRHDAAGNLRGVYV